jgi:carboxyl-terminal processing protease
VFVASLVALLVGCATGERLQSTGPGRQLGTLERVLVKLDEAYVEAPDLTLMAVGAIEVLEQSAPGAEIHLADSDTGTTITYAAVDGERKTIVFPRRAGRDKALVDIRTLFARSREVSVAVPEVELEREMIVKGLRRLDPDSSFLSVEDYRQFLTENIGNFAAVGLELTRRQDSLTVVSPIEGAPALRAGVRPGDRIERIDGVATKDMSLAEAVRRLRGDKNTRIVLTVDRDGWPGVRDIEMFREQIRVKSVAGRDLGGGVAYIRIRNLVEATPFDLDTTFKPLAGAKALILDLRNNPGGLLAAAIQVAERFLAPDTLIAYTESRLPNQTSRFTVRAKVQYAPIAVVVLVNQGTAAGAEIVAGALQDWGRASLVGTKTFGRASIQTIHPLGDGSALRLTTARWFTPKGRMLRSEGLIPELPVDGGTMTLLSADVTTESLLKGDDQLRAALDHVSASVGPRPAR